MFNFIKLLYYKNKIYILSDEVIKDKLIKLYYNDVLTEYYKINRIINLLFRKYYWINIANNVWKYIALYTVY